MEETTIIPVYFTILWTADHTERNVQYWPKWKRKYNLKNMYI